MRHAQLRSRWNEHSNVNKLPYHMRHTQLRSRYNEHLGMKKPPYRKGHAHLRSRMNEHSSVNKLPYRTGHAQLRPRKNEHSSVNRLQYRTSRAQLRSRLNEHSSVNKPPYYTRHCQLRLRAAYYSILIFAITSASLDVNPFTPIVSCFRVRTVSCASPCVLVELEEPLVAVIENVLLFPAVLRFGHVAERCKSNRICICGKPPDDQTPCKDPVKCVNCEGSHMALYKGCPKYKIEAAIQRVKTVERISYIEARNKVEIVTPTSNIYYARAVTRLNEDIQKMLDVLSRIDSITKIKLVLELQILNNPLENLLQWNCNGLRHKYCELRSLLNEKQSLGACIQNTHLKEGETFALRDESSQALFTSRPTISRPAVIRSKEMCENIYTDIPPLYVRKHYDIAPWVISSIPLHDECSCFSKQDTHAETYRRRFLEILNKYDGATIIYTDESKSDDKVGSAFVTGEQVHYWKLNKAASIFTAELYAIWEALRYIEYCQTGTFLICCDSLSALRAITATFSYDPIIQSINEICHWLTTAGKRVILI
nr:unnamed protein product [Callosobruchus analis]